MSTPTQTQRNRELFWYLAASLLTPHQELTMPHPGPKPPGVPVPPAPPIVIPPPPSVPPVSVPAAPAHG